MAIFHMSLSIPTPPKTLSSSNTLSSFNPLLTFTTSTKPLPHLTLRTTQIRMGGGPRTYPGGVSKWQWKRMQAKKAKQLLRARLARERQIYEMRKRAELKAAVSELERPWEAVERPPNLFSASADEQVKVLADRFQRPGGLDLWCDRDGPELFSRPDNGLPSSRFFPKGVVHSVRPYGGKGSGGDDGEIGGKMGALGSRRLGSVGEMEEEIGYCDEFGGVIGGNGGGGEFGEKVSALWSRGSGSVESCGGMVKESGECDDEFGGQAGLQRNGIYGRGQEKVSGEFGEFDGGLIGGNHGEMGLQGKGGCDNGRKVGALGARRSRSVERCGEVERQRREYKEFDGLIGGSDGEKGSRRSGLYGEGEKVGALGSRSSRSLSKGVVRGVERDRGIEQKNGVCEGFGSFSFEDELGGELIGRSDGKMGFRRKGGSDKGEKPSTLGSRSLGGVVREGERRNLYKGKVGRSGNRIYSSDPEGMGSKDVGSYTKNDGRNRRLRNTAGGLRGTKSFEEGNLNTEVFDMSLQNDGSYGFELF